MSVRQSVCPSVRQSSQVKSLRSGRRVRERRCFNGTRQLQEITNGTSTFAAGHARPTVITGIVCKLACTCLSTTSSFLPELGQKHHLSTSKMLPTTSAAPQRTSWIPQYFRRMMKFSQMDMEATFYQMFLLCVSPLRAYVPSDFCLDLFT